MLNLLEKLHILAVTNEVRLWHFVGKRENPKFYYWVESELKADPSHPGYGFDTLEAVIEAAYAVIDPMLKPMHSLPKAPPLPNE
jgi:hypothetical protein